MDATFTTRTPQQEDGTRELIARQMGATIRGTALASAARTVSTVSSDIVTERARALYVWINCTAASGTGGLTLYVQTQDPVSGNWVLTYVATASITTVRTSVVILGDGVSQGSNISLPTGQGDRGINLPKNVRLYMVHGDASSYTYSVGYEIVP